MNVDTGQIYRGQEEIAEAFFRGEPVVSVSERVAQSMEIANEKIGLEAIRIGKQHPEWSQAECIEFARKRLAAGIK